MRVRRETRSGNGLAPVQVFHAVPSSPFSAPAELAGLRPGHSKARCVFPSEENLLASRLCSPSPFGAARPKWERTNKNVSAAKTKIELIFLMEEINLLFI